MRNEFGRFQIPCRITSVVNSVDGDGIENGQEKTFIKLESDRKGLFLAMIQTPSDILARPGTKVTVSIVDEATERRDFEYRQNASKAQSAVAELRKGVTANSGVTVVATVTGISPKKKKASPKKKAKAKKSAKKKK